MNRQPPFLAAIVPAAGLGTRMQSTCPKQYLYINGKYVIEHTLSTLLSHPLIKKIVVALHPNDTMFASLPLAKDPRIFTVTGGKTRADSVIAGLCAITEFDWVLVHDAARPCLRLEDLNTLIKKVLLSKQGGILATPVRDTMKQSLINNDKISHTIDRSYLWHALTPQMFPRSLLLDCLQRAIVEKALITDEASALEYCGYHPRLIKGHADNIKITQPEDVALATYYLTHYK